MRSLMVISVLVGFVLAGCSMSNRKTPGDTKKVPQEDADAQAPAEPAADELKTFVRNWCGSGTLTNLRVLDAEDYLVSAEMPSWLNNEHETNRELWGEDFGGSQEKLISELKSVPMFKAMFPKEKMVLADFSSGSGCRNTLVAIDARAVAYLKKLAASPNALTCEKESQGSYQQLIIKAPGVVAMLGTAYSEDDDPEAACDTALANVLVGHADTGTLTASSVSNPDTEDLNPSLFNFELKSYILEADGSAQFMRSDGAFKFFYSDFGVVYRAARSRAQSFGGGQTDPVAP